jgi:replication fork protection complex subunit Tof1/Swi1
MISPILTFSQAFFPKNRSRWKVHSSYAPEEKTRQPRTAEVSMFPPDVQIKKGFSWSEQVGIAIQVLVDKNQKELIDWSIEVCVTLIF